VPEAEYAYELYLPNLGYAWCFTSTGAYILQTAFKIFHPHLVVRGQFPRAPFGMGGPTPRITLKTYVYFLDCTCRDIHRNYEVTDITMDRSRVIHRAVLDYEPGLQTRVKAILWYQYALLSTEFVDLPTREQFFEDEAELFAIRLLHIRVENLQQRGLLQNRTEAQDMENWWLQGLLLKENSARVSRAEIRQCWCLCMFRDCLQSKGKHEEFYEAEPR